MRYFSDGGGGVVGGVNFLEFLRLALFFFKQSTDRRDTAFRGILVVCLHVYPLYKIYILCIVKQTFLCIFVSVVMSVNTTTVNVSLKNSFEHSLI